MDKSARRKIIYLARDYAVLAEKFQTFPKRPRPVPVTSVPPQGQADTLSGDISYIQGDTTRIDDGGFNILSLGLAEPEPDTVEIICAKEALLNGMRAVEASLQGSDTTVDDWIRIVEGICRYPLSFEHNLPGHLEHLASKLPEEHQVRARVAALFSQFITDRMSPITCRTGTRHPRPLDFQSTAFFISENDVF